jgi:hypothetical protein
MSILAWFIHIGLQTISEAEDDSREERTPASHSPRLAAGLQLVRGSQRCSSLVCSIFFSCSLSLNVTFDLILAVMVASP